MRSKSIIIYAVLVLLMLAYQNFSKKNLVAKQDSISSGRAPASDGFASKIDFSSDLKNATADQLKLRMTNRKLGDEAIRQSQLGIQPAPANK